MVPSFRDFLPSRLNTKFSLAESYHVIIKIYLLNSFLNFRNMLSILGCLTIFILKVLMCIEKIVLLLSSYFKSESRFSTASTRTVLCAWTTIFDWLTIRHYLSRGLFNVINFLIPHIQQICDPMKFCFKIQ